MSDSVNALANLGSGSSLVALLVDLVSIASFRGVPFYMLSSDEQELGRRVVKFLFPHRDDTSYRDMGLRQGDIHIEGLLIGSDSVRQAGKMRTALQTAGPGKLVHPWFGEMNVILTEGAHLSVSEKEFGLVHFEGIFEVYKPPQPPTPDWFGKLQDQVDAMMNQAQATLLQALGYIAAPLAAIGFANQLLNTASAVWDGLSLGAGGTALQQAVGPSIPALQAGPGTVTGTDYAVAVAGLLAAPALALSDASQAATQPAVASATTQAASTTTTISGTGPIGAAAASTAASIAATLDPTLATVGIDPQTAANALLTVSAALAAPARGPVAQQLIALAAQMQAIAQAAAVGATIIFDSTQAAAAWGATIDAAIAGLLAQAATLAVVQPLVAGAAWRALDALRAAAAADTANRQLSLPSILTLTTNTTMSVWRMALILCGDTPSLMTACVVDLWRRNRLGNPAAVQPGTYQALPQ
jgi:hypothetical protein